MVGTGVIFVLRLFDMMSMLAVAPDCSHCTGGIMPLATTTLFSMSSTIGIVLSVLVTPSVIGLNCVIGFQASKKRGPSSMTTALSKNCVVFIFGISGTAYERPFREKTSCALSTAPFAANAVVSAVLEIVIEGNCKLMLLILFSNTLSAFSSQTTLMCTSTVLPSTCIDAMTMPGLHSPLTTAVHVAVVVATGGSWPFSRMETSIGAPMSDVWSTMPKVKSSMLSAYSQTPVLIWLLVILYWPFAPILTT
mmetsp:Transcript_20105/g.56057  ORF Transcript_20105/g.56057 Transcript_20105/m.56057 type:complete len:250 (-) Transcript_20105:259-1008(-)